MKSTRNGSSTLGWLIVCSLPKVKFSELTVLQDQFEEACTKALSTWHLKPLRELLDGFKSCIPRYNEKAAPARAFQLRLIQQNIIHGDRFNEFRQSFLYLARHLVEQLRQHKVVLARQEIIMAVCEAGYDHVGCSSMFLYLHGNEMNGEPAYGYQYCFSRHSIEVDRAAYVIAITNGWRYPRPASLGEKKDLLFTSHIFGSLFAAAARSGRISSVAILLKFLDAPDPSDSMHAYSIRAYRFVVLEVAISYGNLEMAEMMIKPSYKLIYEKEFLDHIYGAARFGHFKIVSRLIQALPVSFQFSTTEMMAEICCLACEFGNNDFILEMLRKGGKFRDALADSRWKKPSPIAMAAEYNRVSTVKILLDHRVKVIWPPSERLDAFVVAATHGHLDVIRLFCARRVDRADRLRLDFAVARTLKSGHLNVAEFLWPRLLGKYSPTGVPQYRQLDLLCNAEKSRREDVLDWLKDKLKLLVEGERRCRG